MTMTCEGELTPFGIAFCRTMISEGGYTSAGPTYMGIDRRYWPDWYGWKVVDRWLAGELTVLERDEALPDHVRSFCRKYFWARMHGDILAQIDLEVTCKVFDIGVNMDIPDGIWCLQTALNDLYAGGGRYPELVDDGKMRIDGPTMERFRLWMTDEQRPLERRRGLLVDDMCLIYGGRIRARAKKDPRMIGLISRAIWGGRAC